MEVGGRKLRPSVDSTLERNFPLPTFTLTGRNGVYMTICMKDARNSRRFEFVSYSETYADYLAALETPALLLPYVLTTPAKINIVRRSDDGEGEEGAEYTWRFVTGQLLRSIVQIVK